MSFSTEPDARYRTVAVIAAHPDDEVLGCGGAMAAHSDRGDRVHVLIVAEGATSRQPARDRDAAAGEFAVLADAAQAAHAVLGSASLKLLGFPDNRMDSVDLLDVTKAVEDWLNEVRPDIVYTHYPHDLNVDHRYVSEAVQTACRPQPGGQRRQILFFEVPSSTEWRLGAQPFAPNYYADISATLGRKLKALDCYASEMRAWPHARSVPACEHLARWRGASIGVEAAEAFVAGRLIDALMP